MWFVRKMTDVCENKIKKFVIQKKIYKRSKKKVTCMYSKNYIVSNNFKWNDVDCLKIYFFIFKINLS